MLEQFLAGLKRFGWEIVILDEEWVCAVDEQTSRGLLFAYLKTPLKKPPMDKFTTLKKWDAIIICPQGVSSKNLRDSNLYGIQAWFLDLHSGEVFPYPPSKDSSIIDWLFQIIRSDTNDELKSPNTKLKTSNSNFVPYAAYTLIGIYSLIFIVMFLVQGLTYEGFDIEFSRQILIAFGAKHNALINQGEFWRLLTSTFIHTGLVHLIFNLYALMALGAFAEDVFGRWKFLSIYIISGLTGSIASYFFSDAVSAGASGAIFGLLGSLLFFTLRNPQRWRSGLGTNLIIVILINLGFGLLVPRIDNYAHLGGLLSGFFVAPILLGIKKHNS
ncbi:MAG: rhomboid family intramembrane serine protease [Desulfitobacterium hafniense]|nr:rhomboid family intramembrane serine protease [Desulfitobacterium hafniense]